MKATTVVLQQAKLQQSSLDPEEDLFTNENGAQCLNL
jgi:hypothetical protein